MSRLPNSPYLRLSTAAGAGGGFLVGAVVGQVWRHRHGAGKPHPSRRALHEGIRDALHGDALPGSAFGLVKAAVARADGGAVKRPFPDGARLPASIPMSRAGGGRSTDRRSPQPR